MSSSIKTSIIIPVYNVEKYLPKCLDSCINQTLQDIEIICVNDESPDNSAKILEDYAKKDSRIVLLSQKNSDQGSARNRGLEVAKGKYIRFLDSDDYYEPNCCEEMYNLMEEHSDINVACFDTNIIYDAYYELRKDYDTTYFQMRYKGKVKNRQSMISSVDCNCWNKIFRKSFIDKNNIRFPEKLHYEDYAFFWFWMTRTDYIYFYHKKLTNYLRREGSFLGEIFEKSSQTIFDDFKVFELIYNDLVAQEKFPLYKQTYFTRYLNNFRWLINCFADDNYQDKQKLVNICADFLSKFDFSDITLENWAQTFKENILKKNYYLFGAFNNHIVDKLKPVYPKNSVNIVFSSDENYIPCLSVAIQSIIENASSENNYDIIILFQEIYEYQKRFILSMAEPYPNISIRFLNMAQYVEKFGLDKLFTVNHITFSAYFRLFIGQLMEKYNRVLYLDCDLVATQDVANLFHMDIGDYPIAAVQDTTISHSLTVPGYDGKRWDCFKNYMSENLGFASVPKYFNSGVLLIDIPKFNETDLDYLVDLAQRNNSFFHDQNVLNAAFEGNYFPLPPTWNLQWNIKFHNNDYSRLLPADLCALYEDPNIRPAIIHYTSHEKPWKNPYHAFADIWWKYAIKSPFYPLILKDFLNIQNSGQVMTPPKGDSIQYQGVMSLLKYRKNRIKYFLYSTLLKLPFFKNSKRIKNRKMKYKDRVKRARRIMKSNVK